MSRVLLISYLFPPVGGAGVQRASKFVKYLPGVGWGVSVLTASNPSVPLHDASLNGLGDERVHVVRCPTWEPPYAMKASVSGGAASNSRGGLVAGAKTLVRGAANLALQPDPQILWAPSAVAHGRRVLRARPHDVILATAPPYSAFIVGARLSRRSGVPLVLDYRDEWEISNNVWENRKTQGFSQKWQKSMQNRLLRQASAVIATTEASAERIAGVARRAGSAAEVTCIYNGYDPEDFTGQPPARGTSDRVCLRYTGTLWGLTSIEPIVSAMELLASRDPEAADRLELSVVGRRTGDQDALVSRLAGAHHVHREDYVPHSEVINRMRTADWLCLLLSDTHDAPRVVPAKVFEYMAARRPILAVAPRGELWRLLEPYPAAKVHEPGDVEGIAQTLSKIARGELGYEDVLRKASVAKHSRVEQTGQLASILETVAKRGAAARGAV